MVRYAHEVARYAKMQVRYNILIRGKLWYLANFWFQRCCILQLLLHTCACMHMLGNSQKPLYQQKSVHWTRPCGMTVSEQSLGLTVWLPYQAMWHFVSCLNCCGWSYRQHQCTVWYKKTLHAPSISSDHNIQEIFGQHFLGKDCILWSRKYCFIYLIWVIFLSKFWVFN